MRNLKKILSIGKRLKQKKQNWLIFLNLFILLLKKALQERGINALYTHQREAFDSVMEGNSIVAVTPTASGKTLCYNLPVIETIIE